jgi:NADPH:quinone reductase-like Zn-dependent oxidoreductase
MRALRTHTRGGPDQLVCETAPTPEPGTGDALVQVHAASYTPGELQWPSTWIDRRGHDRTPVIPCHEVSGIVCGLGFGATGVSIGDEVYGLTDWYRDGAAAELIAVEARNLALRPRSVDQAAASTLPLAGLTAWQGLFRHGALDDGETLIVLGAGGGVGNLAVQLARHAGARVLGIGHDKDRAATLHAGASAFVDPDHEPLPSLTETSLVLDAVGGTLARSVAAALGSTGRFVSIVDPEASQLVGSRGTFFVVEPDRDCLTEIARRVDEGSLSPVIGRQSDLRGGPKLFEAKELGRVPGKVSITVSSDLPPDDESLDATTLQAPKQAARRR